MSRHSRPTAIVVAAVLLLVAFAAAGCSKSGPGSADVIARVNGVDISKATIDKQIAQMKVQSPKTFESTQGVQIEQQYRAQLLDNLIRQELVNEAAKSLGVAVTSKQVDDYVAGLEQQYGSKDALETAMKTAGIDSATLREQITNSLLTDAVSSKVASGGAAPTAAQVKAYYDANKSQFGTPAQVHAEHILLATKDKALAQTVLAKVKAGGNFAALAKQYSTDPGTKDNGGDLGWAAPTAYVTEFADAVDTMKVGDVKLVQSQFGWHIVKLLGRRAATQQTLQQATAAVTQTLQQNARADAFAQYLAGLRKKATIEIFDKKLETLINAVSASSGTKTP
ncbi:MAG TPA: peptidylprolyl isomerase [Coriobacteriia bacterium]